MGKSQGTPLLAAGGNGPASPAYGCVKPRLAFSLESPLDESGGQAREIKLKSFPTETPGRFTSPVPTELHAGQDASDVIYVCYRGRSMNPTLWESDLLEVFPYGVDQIQVGDVIAFQSEGCEEYTIHRAIKVEEHGIKARGDNNDSVDPFWIQPDQVVGKVLALRRGQKLIRVLSGMPGLIWSHFIRTLGQLEQVISTEVHPLYRALSRNGILLSMLSKQYQPQIQRFTGNGRDQYKVTIGNRVVGLYDNDTDVWRIRRPFRLFMDERKLAGIMEL